MYRVTVWGKGGGEDRDGVTYVVERREERETGKWSHHECYTLWCHNSFGRKIKARDISSPVGKL